MSSPPPSSPPSSPQLHNPIVPCVGIFGTCFGPDQPDEVTEEIVVKAIVDCGYRHLDTALLYGSQTGIGNALKRVISTHGIPREDIFVTTKISFFPTPPPGNDKNNKNNLCWMWKQTKNGTLNVKGTELKSFDVCLKELGSTHLIEYIDCCLIHNPVTDIVQYKTSSMPHFFELFNQLGIPGSIDPKTTPNGDDLRSICMDGAISQMKQHILGSSIKEEDSSSFYDTYHQHCYEERKECWLEMEKLCSNDNNNNKCRSIGVSNYTSSMIEEMMNSNDGYVGSRVGSTRPVVNQIEYHPKFRRDDIVKTCHKYNIRVAAYGQGFAVSIDSKVRSILTEIGTGYDPILSPYQVIVRWTVQKGILSIMCANEQQYMKENLESATAATTATLSDEDMIKIDNLNEHHPYYWHPTPIELSCKKQDTKDQKQINK